MKPFYITTPIYYANDTPHIGHAYTTVATDALARYHRLRGRRVRFLTGTDEHGQKIEQKASELGQSPKAFVDALSPLFRKAFEDLNCSFDDYIRTTEPRHEERVQKLWSKLQATGDIYLGHYEGWYSVADEAFVTEQELKTLDEVTRKQVQRVKEESYFFRLSAYGEKLLEHYEKNPNFVEPRGRFNEVKSFVRAGLRDLSISRTRFTWGVPVPGDDKHVMYVWLDALTNYISALGGPAEPGESPLFDTFWGSDAEQIHIVGKEITRFHAVYWPAFLLAAGIELPNQIWAHGWLTINGEKMSKRLGNFIQPGPLVDEFGADVVRYYLMREVAFGQDGDFSHKNLVARYNGELANGLGNLLNRMVSSIVKRNLDGQVPKPAGDLLAEDEELIAAAQRAAEEAANHLSGVAPYRALDAVFDLVGAANRYVDRTAPWALAKNGDTERLQRVAYTVLETLRWLSVLIAPFMPAKSDALRRQLGLAPLAPAENHDHWPQAWGELKAGTQTEPGDALFPRIDKKQEAAILARLVPSAAPAAADAPRTPSSKTKSKNTDAASKTIDADHFFAVDLRIGRVLEAEEIAKSKRLIKLKIDLGEPIPRQILAGIREHYAAEALLGKQVVVVANLKPRSIMGIESQGMVLAASHGSGLCVIGVDREVPTGTRVS